MASSRWMSHNDAVQVAPRGFPSPDRRPVPRSRHSRTPSAGWPGAVSPEVLHTRTAAGATRFLSVRHRRPRTRLDWGQHRIPHRGQVRAQVGDGLAICGLSGGVDSAVAAAAEKPARHR